MSLSADRLLSFGPFQKIISITFIFLIVFYSYQFFFSFYEYRAQEKTNDKYMISTYVKDNSPTTNLFVVVGDFWSSEILYNSNRKGIMISPENFNNQYKEFKQDYFKKISQENLDNKIIGGYITDQEELKLIFQNNTCQNFWKMVSLYLQLNRTQKFNFWGKVLFFLKNLASEDDQKHLKFLCPLYYLHMHR